MTYVPQQRIISALSQPSIWRQANPEAVRETTRDILEDQTKKEFCQKLSALFEICGDRCSCRTPSPSSCAPLEEGGFQQPSSCSNAETCPVFRVFVRHLDLLNILAKASVTKGDLFSQRLAASVAIYQLYSLAVPRDLPPAERAPRKRRVKELLCLLVDCQRNRLQCLKQIGQLGTFLPNLLCVQIASGRSLFWDQLRKVARSVNGQASVAAKRAVLAAIRNRLPEDSKWSPFLTSQDADQP